MERRVSVERRGRSEKGGESGAARLGEGIVGGWVGGGYGGEGVGCS